MIRRIAQLFRRQSSGDSAIDWRVGDVAVCTHPGPWFLGGYLPAPGPERGEARKVIEVSVARDVISGAKVQFLSFTRFGPATFVARCFVRIDPRADALEAADAEFLASLKPARVLALLEQGN